MISTQADVTSFVVLREFQKIIKRILGQENMFVFGYRSITSNQLYLLYLICGKIYFTDRICSFVKYSWLIINLCAVLVICTTGMTCLIYDTKRDVWKWLDIMMWLGVSLGLSIQFPALVYYYRHDIEEMIQGIDDFFKIRISKTTYTSHESSIDVNALIIFNFSSAAVLIVIHSFVCVLDVVLFFEEEKVRNFNYYVFPLPNTEENGSSKLFALNCLLLVFNSPLYIFTWIAGVTMVLLWGAACHNELVYVQDRFDSRMDELSLRIQNESDVSQTWDMIFNQILVQDIKAFNTINRTINNFKGFVQFASSLAIPINFLGQIAQLSTIISRDMPLPVRIKVISFFLMIIWPMFLLYWVGQILENGISSVSFSVYCSPWQHSVIVRRNIHIFLGQTQRSGTLFMWKVYPLVLRNFSRLIQTTQAAVNLLRKIVR